MANITSFFLLALIIPASALFSSVVTGNGEIRGIAMTFSSRFLSRTVRVDSYLGIPYAKPPIGELRFRPAEPVDPFDDIYNATEVPPSCIQVIRPYFEHFIAGSGFSEDCLYLNVFVPETAPPNASVMFWIHGGLFVWGSGSDFPYNPLPLAALGNVIVVTINYRLTLMGFFSTGDDGLPPNLALTDQRLAMQWVNRNIAAFGGDPNKVTIFGEGSGAACVGWHVLSPGSRPYFQRAVLQSGNPLDPWAEVMSPEMAFEIAQVAANIANCTPPVPEDTSFIADCFRTKSVDELLEISVQTNAFYFGVSIWLPVVDGDFFPKNITELIADGDYSDVDILLGTTRDEGTWLVYFFLGFPPGGMPFITKTTFSAIAAGTTDPLISDLLEVVYSTGVAENGNYFGALADAVGDTCLTCGMVEFARRVATAGSNVYMYRLAHVPARSIWNFTIEEATHYEDLQFVFGVPFQDDPFFVPDYEELKVSFYVMRMWTNFAKSGNPNLPVRLTNDISEWPEFLPDTQEYKELDIDFTNRRNLRQHYCNFWDNLLPQIRLLIDVVALTDDK